MLNWKIFIISLLFGGFGFFIYNCAAETNPNSNFQLYGHRGCRGLEPENSIPSYKKALELGIDYIDMDVNLTMDGFLVVAHNSSLNPDFTRKVVMIDKKRVLGDLITKDEVKLNNLYIKNMNLKDVQNNYDIGWKDENSKYSKLFPDQKMYKDGTVKIPTLKEVIDYVKKNDSKAKFQIEMKCSLGGFNHSTESGDMANALYKILKEEKIINRTKVQSFDWIALTTLKEIAEKDGYNIKTAYLLIPPIGILAKDLQKKIDNNPELKNQQKQSEKNIQPYKDTYDKHGDSNWTGNSKSLYEYLIKCFADCGAYSVEPLSNCTTESMINIAHENGLKLIAWGSPELTGSDFDKNGCKILIDLGVDGIITDRPDELKNLISGK